MPYRTPAGAEIMLAAHGEGFDLLLGRRTYDSWAEFWPKAPSGPMADRLNAATKFVATHRRETLGQWGPVADLGRDVVEGVRRIKSEGGPNLVLCGSSSLTSALLEHGLADEVLLVTYPVLIGIGKRLFAEGTPGRAFDLVASNTTPTGIVLNVYKPVGPLPSA